MESSQRDVFIDMIVDRFIFKNNRITLSPCFSLAKPGVGRGAFDSAKTISANAASASP